MLEPRTTTELRHGYATVRARLMGKRGFVPEEAMPAAIVPPRLSMAILHALDTVGARGVMFIAEAIGRKGEIGDVGDLIRKLVDQRRICRLSGLRFVITETGRQALAKYEASL